MILKLLKNNFVIIPLYLLGFIILSQVQHNFYYLLAAYTYVFAIYFLGVEIKLRFGLGAALIIILGTRLPFMFDLPGLSTDFYRFLWDGLLMNEGLNPIGRVPIEQNLYNFKNVEFAKMLLENMNSAHHSGVLPTFHQGVFALAYFLGGSEILTGVNVIRGLIISVELFFFFAVMLRGKASTENVYVFAYLINPLVIVEGVGNIHFEVIFLPFLAISMMDFKPQRFLKSSVTYASSLLVKLNTFIYAPLLIFKTDPKVRFKFFASGLFICFIFAAMMEPLSLFKNYKIGLGLYLGGQEFNGMIFYVLKFFVQFIAGARYVTYLATLLSIFSIILIFYVSWKYRKSKIHELALVVFLIYFLFSSFVQPWYIIPGIYFALRSDRNYILIWSYTVILSYAFSFHEVGYKWIFIFVEYASLAVAIVLEGRRKKWLQPAFLG